MDKELIYNNICDLINNGYFLKKYIELTYYEDIDDINNSDNIKRLENIAANIFNAIVIGCQLFDNQELIISFVDENCLGFNAYVIEDFLDKNNISHEVALDRLRHGFGLHFTTKRISDEIKKHDKLTAFGKNSMFTKEEDEMINYASKEQQKDDYSRETMRYLFRGFGTGSSSYGSMTNGFWMYHTPESLSFLFGDISKRDKANSMNYVLECVSTLNEEDKNNVINVMSNIWDRLVGDEQFVCCVLIDRDAFKYEVDYYYNLGPEPVAVERRPFSNGLGSLDDSDLKIQNDLSVDSLRFIRIPTIKKLEKMKKEKLENEITHSL